MTDVIVIVFWVNIFLCLLIFKQYEKLNAINPFVKIQLGEKNEQYSK